MGSKLFPLFSNVFVGDFEVGLHKEKLFPRDVETLCGQCFRSRERTLLVPGFLLAKLLVFE